MMWSVLLLAAAVGLTSAQQPDGKGMTFTCQDVCGQQVTSLYSKLEKVEKKASEVTNLYSKLDKVERKANDNEKQLVARVGDSEKKLIARMGNNEKKLDELRKDFEDATLPKCPPGFSYVKGGKSCYKTGTNKLDWSAASRSCRSSNAHLVVIGSVAEQMSVVDWYTKNKGCTGGFWTAGQRIDPNHKSSPFVWKVPTSTGGYQALWMPYSNWYPGEPNFYKGRKESCVHTHEHRLYQWNDAVCSDHMCYVCEYEI